MRKLRYPVSNTNWLLVGLALSLLIPSTAIIQKYLGIAGVVIYIMVAFSVLFVGYKYVFTALVPKVTERETLWLTVATFLVLSLAFFVMYPLANSGAFGGPGSDRDEALNIATTELLNGHYPYYLETYLGNPISPMPGALLLAIPFVLLGNSAYQDLFWLLAFFFAMKSYLKDGCWALLLLWVILALSPSVLQELVTGGDLLANSLYVLLFAMWTVSAISRSDLSGWGKLLPAILLGIGLSSRANFVLLLPLIFSALVQGAGWRPAVKYVVVTCVTFIVVTMPFYLYDPQGFSPLHTADELGQFGSVVPSAGIVIPLVAGVIALILALERTDRGLRVLLRNCAIVLAFPVLCGVILSSAEAAKLDFEFAAYGMPFLVFGSVAFWAMLPKTRGAPARAPSSPT